MRNSVMHRVAKIIRSTRKRSPAVLEKINGPYFKLALFAVALFSLACAAETKAILALESSQSLFEVMR
jgi:hypothetical protein